MEIDEDLLTEELSRRSATPRQSIRGSLNAEDFPDKFVSPLEFDWGHPEAKVQTVEKDSPLPSPTPLVLWSMIIQGAYSSPSRKQVENQSSESDELLSEGEGAPAKPTKAKGYKPQVVHLTHQQVYKMANRSMPIVSTQMDFKSTQQEGNRHLPGCNSYLSWLQRKKQLRENLSASLTLEDMIDVSRTAALVDPSLAWDQVASRARATNAARKRSTEVFEPTEVPKNLNIPRRSCLAQKTTALMRRGVSHLPDHLRNVVDLDDPSSATYWLTHVGDPLLDVIFDLYMTQSRQVQRGRPDVYRELFEAQGVPLTTDHLHTFLHDVLVAANAETCPTTSCRKSMLIHDEGLLCKLVNHEPLKLQRREGASGGQMPFTAVMEGPEFPPLLKPCRKTSSGIGMGAKSYLSSRRASHTRMPAVRAQMKLEKKHCSQKLLEKKKAQAKKARSKWKKAFRMVRAILKVAKLMSERTFDLDADKCFADMADDIAFQVEQSEGRYINLERFKKRKKLTINPAVQTTLRQEPEERSLIDIDHAVQEFQKVQAFSEYPWEIQNKLMRRAIFLSIGRRRVIVRQGDTAQYCYIIVSGEAVAKTRWTDPSTGRETVKRLNTLTAGTTFGEVDLMKRVRRTVTVVSRGHMQLLALEGKDYKKIFALWRRKQAAPLHVQYMQQLDIMSDWPVEEIAVYPSLCTVRHFRRNTVITHDSRNSPNLYIIRSGYCKVFRKLDWADPKEDVFEKKNFLQNFSAKENEARSSFREDDSGSCWIHIWRRRDRVEVKDARGRLVHFPVTNVNSLISPAPDNILRALKEQRKFVPLNLLRESDVFGLDQTSLFKSRRNSRAVILVSLGADCIALNKALFCHFATDEVVELVNLKTFAYSDDFIRIRLHEQFNRDVHLEHILDHYFQREGAD